MTQKEMEIRLINLEKAFIQSQKNIASTVDKTDKNISEIKAITPYMESKRVYIDDTSCVFENVRGGNTTAFMVSDNGLGIPCTIARSGDSVVVSFEKLEEVATVTISVL